MNNRISVILASCVIILLFLGCYTLEGSRGVSSNIEESKKRRVFVCEYETAQNPYFINDSIIIDVDEMWLEERWAYGSRVEETLNTSDYQLIIDVKGEETFKNYISSWVIGVDGSLYFRPAGKKSLMCDLTSLPQDTISIPVQRELNLGKGQEKDIFATFKIHRRR